MKLLTNFSKEMLNDIKDCARIAGLKYEIRDKAYRIDNKQLLPDNYALWCEEGQEHKIERFFHCMIILNHQLQELYQKHEIPEELYYGKELYRGCEMEYFPEYMEDEHHFLY